VTVDPCDCPGPPVQQQIKHFSASEATALRRYTNQIIIIIINLLLCHMRN